MNNEMEIDEAYSSGYYDGKMWIFVGVFIGYLLGIATAAAIILS